jgi:hypothetical protein
MTFISSNRRVIFFLLYSRKRQSAKLIFDRYDAKFFNQQYRIVEIQRIPGHHFSIFLYYFIFRSRQKHVVFSLNEDKNWFAVLRLCYFENKFIGGK